MDNFLSVFDSDCFVGFSFRWIGWDFVCADWWICGRQGGLWLMGGCQMGLSCFQNGKCRVFGAGNLTFCVVFVFGGWIICLPTPL